jgi:hypothetical protein
MNKIYYKKSHGEHYFRISCPSINVKEPFSMNCGNCFYYQGKFNNEKAIQCSYKEFSENYITLQKFLLTEKSVIQHSGNQFILDNSGNQFMLDI